MKLFTLLNDDKPFEPYAHIEKVGQITIKYNPLLAKTFAIPAEEAKRFSKWLFDLCQRSTEKYVLINETLVLKEDIKLYKGN